MLTAQSPVKGSAIIFSSGWENMHEVQPLASGTRFAVPSFFTTCSTEPGDAPEDDVAIAEELSRTLLFPENVGDYRQFVRRWHYLLAPQR